MRETIYFLFILVMVSCTASRKATRQAEDSILVNGITLKSNETTLTLPKGPLSIEFSIKRYDSANKKWYSAGIAGTTKEEDVQFFQEGPISTENPFFAPMGTGIASERDDSYPTLYTGYGHHYFFYKSPKEHRATFIKKLENDKVRLKWTVGRIFIDEIERPIQNADIDVLYLMIFIDENLNDTIEKGEYHRVKIIFE